MNRTRHDIIEIVGSSYLTTNIEGGEYSYVQEAGSKKALKRALGRDYNHFKLDLRFEDSDFVVLIETKQNSAENPQSLQSISCFFSSLNIIKIGEEVHPWKMFVMLRTGF